MLKKHGILRSVVVIILIFTACSDRKSSDQEQAKKEFELISTGNSALANWDVYSGDKTGTKYSSLDQINKSNVRDLQVAWRYSTGDSRKAPRTTIECNPIVVGQKMFVTTPGLKVVALNAASGEELWKFDPYENEDGKGVNRGTTYWSNGMEARLFYVAGSLLYALNAENGELITSFGTDGKVDLYEGLGREVRSTWVTAATPGIIYKNLLIMGSTLGEGPAPVAPGHIRAYDVISGEMKWIFHTIPHPGEFGYETWPKDAWLRVGGANVWGGFTLDEERGVVYCGTGSPSYDHWGGDRLGENLFGNCILALDAKTGERIWHYQVVHHDIWDYDIPCPPNLVTVKINDEWVDALAQPTKMGHLFVLNRDTGEPIFPIEEKEVPQSDIPGEETWPTQPFPPQELIYAKQSFQLEDITDLNREAHDKIYQRVKDMQLGSIFLPPSFQGSITMPQFNGGTDWGGAAYDPESQILVVNCSNEVEWISMMTAKPPKEISQNALGQKLYQAVCSVCHGYGNPQNPGSPSLENLKKVKESQTREQIYELLENGRGQMPQFPTLSEVEKDAIISFLWDEGRNKKIDVEKSEFSFSNQIPYVATGHRVLKDPNGFPANTRPWGTLTAIDLNEASIVWQETLGTYPELEQQGFAPTGTFNMGGPIITKGGLVFIASTMDERIRAFDMETGNVVWEFQLNAGGYATPATYQVDGKQYLVIAAGGGGKPGTKSGDEYVCFSLP